LSSPSAKNIFLLTSPKSQASYAHPVPQEGRIAIVTVRWVRDAVDALVLQTSGADADGEVVWS
jgi:hypothetical protein